MLDAGGELSQRVSPRDIDLEIIEQKGYFKVLVVTKRFDPRRSERRGQL